MKPRRKALAPDMPEVLSLRDAMRETQKAALAGWACGYAEEALLPLWEVRRPGDARPRAAIGAARAWLRGAVKLPQARGFILNCHAAAREAQGDPAAQGVARAVGHAASSIHSARHAMGLALYGALALAYDRLGPGAAWADLEKAAAGEVRNMEASLRTFAAQGGAPEPGDGKVHA